MFYNVFFSVSQKDRQLFAKGSAHLDKWNAQALGIIS